MEHSPAELAAAMGPGRRISARRLVLAVTAAVAATVALVVALSGPTTGERHSAPLLAGFPDNAEWDGNPRGPLTRVQVAEISRWDSVEILPKFDAKFNIQHQLFDARRLVSSARRLHRHLAVYMYFSAAFWFRAEVVGWGNYARTFRPQWLMRDSQGRLIPYYGSASTDANPAGYLVDLRNSAYRRWAVRTIVSWMEAAPLAGVTIDNADLLSPTAAVPRGIASGPIESYQHLLCGTVDPNCPVLASWNAGLRDLLAEARSALHRLGDTVLYNGIAPTVQRGVGRNLGLLREADGASDEAFCFKPLADPLVLTNVATDVRIMQRAAAEEKILLEISDYGGQPDAAKLGPYCFGAFLMGWQPGKTFFVFHSSYDDPMMGPYPEVWQQRLNLGPPLAKATFDGDLMFRRFAGGFVAVNTGYRTESITAPSSGVEYGINGRGLSFSRGDVLDLRPHTALYAATSAIRSSPWLLPRFLRVK